MDFNKKPHIENPRKGANFISQIFFLWTVPLFWKGMKNGLSTDDLTKCLHNDKSKKFGDKLEQKWKQELETASKIKRKPRLWKVLFRIYAPRFFLIGLCRFSDIMWRTAMSLVLAQLLILFQKPAPSSVEKVDTNATDPIGMKTTSFMNTDQGTMNYVLDDIYRFFQHTWNDAFYVATLLILMTFISTIVAHHSLLRLKLEGARMRIACCSLLYRKSIHLSASGARQAGTGHLVNLMSNDAARLETAMLFVNYIWILPIQSAAVGYFIWQRARWVGIVGVTCLLLKTVPAQTFIARYRSLLRQKTALLTDQRVGIMNEIIQGIQVIKMYVWEIPFQKVIAEARRLEIQQIRLVAYIGSLSISSLYFVGRSTLFISIVVLAVTGQNITADIVFSMARYFQLLQLNAAFYFPMALSCGAEALVSLKRIENILLEAAKNETKSCAKRQCSNMSRNVKGIAIEFNNVSACWKENSNIETLSQINLRIKSGELCAVVGPVGGGKSSLIQVLLDELPVKSGEIIVNGSISYAAQEPWIFSGTVRNNILFGQSYDETRYDEVVKGCALVTDFKQLPNGDKTFVGDRGASLSGGQRARISLARAMYKTASIYLLDDPLSAVDAHVGKHLYDEVIGPKAQIAKDAVRVLVTHQVHQLKEADVIVIIENGRIVSCGTYAELYASNIDFAKLMQQHNEDESREQSNETFTNKNETNHQSDYAHNKISCQDNKSVSEVSMASRNSTEIEDTEKKEEQVKGYFSWRTFSYYFSMGLSRCQILLLIFVFICSQCAVSGTDYYVKYFLYQEFNRENGVAGLLTQAEYLYIYGALIFGLIFICIYRDILLYSVCMRSSKALHDRMIAAVLYAPMRFFDSNSSGRILNRMSSDMGLIDDSLPPKIVDAVGNLISIFGALVVIIVVNPTTMATLLGILFVYVLVLRLYFRTSLDLQRLEGICRSPVFAHLTATINGLSTIRTRDIDQQLCHEFDELQDVHSSVSLLTLKTIRAYGLWMDCVGTTLLACVTYTFIFLYRNSFSGNVGLVISQVMSLSGLVQQGMQGVTQTIQQMTSIERILQYTELEPENSPTIMPPADWPTSGNLKFQNMSLRYDPDGGPILKNISVDIQSGSKVGIVGRTGAGKSSLITALFRFAHIEGLIEIDGINIQTISLASLRSNISIIPQNPVLFSGTLRNNLDPLKQKCDDEIWKALEHVQMKNIVSASSGLNMPIMANGSRFSVGQRQLLCLARAILHKHRILILDEATANVDLQTDQLIQQAIRERFAGCTVLTIAHRLNTIIDLDRILVMDAGECVEFDSPSNLLTKEMGIFRGMVKALGDKEYDRLYKISSCETAK